MNQRSLGVIAAAVIAFVCGCSNPIQQAVNSADVINGAMERTEEQLAEVCSAVEIQAVEESESEQEALQRIQVIHAKCQEAWDAYNTFREHMLDLQTAVASRDLDYVLECLGQLVRDERRFVELVRAIVGDYGEDAQ